MFECNETLEAARARNVQDALREDIGRCDWTARLLPEQQLVRAHVVAKEAGVLCGAPWFDACFRALDSNAEIEWLLHEGAEFERGTKLCRLSAQGRAVVSAERAALNFLQMLSCVATTARRYARAIEGVSPNPAGCRVLDTRKTLPGLRQAQKYAVRIGGGANHRMALWDGILIKENHIAAAGGIAAALGNAAALNAHVGIQIEVESLAELEEALAAGARNVLLDDFPLGDMCRAYEVTAGRALLEVSGGVDLDRIRSIAATGVDRISVGKLTKDVHAVDLSLRVEG